MKEQLISCVQGQMTHLDTVNTEELGDVIDMIKDLSEAVYYCTITEAMEEKEKENGKEKEYHYYTERFVPDYRGMDKNSGRMYFDESMYFPGSNYPRYYQEPNMMYYNGSSGGGSGSSGGGNSNSGGSSSSGGSGSSGGGNSGGGGSSSGGNNARGGGSRGYSEREFPIEMRDEREGRSPMSRRTYMESKEMHQDKNIKLKELEKYMQELSTDVVEMIQGASPEEKQLLEKRISALATKIGQLNV